MAKLVIHAGDFQADGASILLPGILVPQGSFHMRPQSSSKSECILFSQLATVEAASEESVKRIGGTLGWGALGTVVLGPVGLLAGLLLGGKGKDVTFVAKLKDGRKLMATTDSGTYTKILAAVF